MHTYKEQLGRQQVSDTEAGIEDAVRQLSYDLRGHVNATLASQEDEKSVEMDAVDVAKQLAAVRSRISNRVLGQVVEELVDKVEGRKYDQALYDALRALVTVYGETDSFVVSAQEDGLGSGALSIYLKR